MSWQQVWNSTRSGMGCPGQEERVVILFCLHRTRTTLWPPYLGSSLQLLSPQSVSELLESWYHRINQVVEACRCVKPQPPGLIILEKASLGWAGQVMGFLLCSVCWRIVSICGALNHFAGMPAVNNSFMLVLLIKSKISACFRAFIWLRLVSIQVPGVSLVL